MIPLNSIEIWWTRSFELILLKNIEYLLKKRNI
jgi:hypothetical protein